MKKLSKEEMKKVMGGLSDKKCHMCCMDDDPSHCSICVESSDSATCPTKGSSLKDCSSC